MTAVIHNIEIEQGATFVLDITYKDGAGAVINLTGYKAKMQVRDKAGKKLLDATTANGRIVVSAQGGILISLTAAETIGIPVCLGEYDLFLENVAGTLTEKVVMGDADIVKAVTR